VGVAGVGCVSCAAGRHARFEHAFDAAALRIVEVDGMPVGALKLVRCMSGSGLPLSAAPQRIGGCCAHVQLEPLRSKRRSRLARVTARAPIGIEPTYERAWPWAGLRLLIVDDIRRATAAGFTARIAKPILLDTLAEVIGQVRDGAAKARRTTPENSGTAGATAAGDARNG
jgi:hypothetical protein